MGDNLGHNPPFRFNENQELQTNPTDNLVTYAADHGAEAATAIITPPSGHSIEIHSVYVSSDSTNTDTFIDFSGGQEIFKLYVNTFTTAMSPRMHIDGGVDETVNLTCPANTFVIVIYHIS